MLFTPDYTNQYYFLQDSSRYRTPELNCNLQYNLSKPVWPAINFTFELPKWDISQLKIQQPWFNWFNPPQLTVPDISCFALTQHQATL